jgi:hypothetical protein
MLSADQLYELYYRESLGASFLSGTAIEPPRDAERGIGLPPAVAFTSPVPAQTARARLFIGVRAVSMGGGVSEIRLFANGEQVEASVDAGTQKERPDAGGTEETFDVVLIPGENVIEAEAYNVLGRARSGRITAKVAVRSGGEPSR